MAAPALRLGFHLFPVGKLLANHGLPDPSSSLRFFTVPRVWSHSGMRSASLTRCQISSAEAGRNVVDVAVSTPRWAVAVVDGEAASSACSSSARISAAETLRRFRTSLMKPLGSSSSLRSTWEV